MDFDIVNIMRLNVDACATFMYKGHLISFSTVGRSKGSCRHPVAILVGEKFDTFHGEFYTVEDAIRYIDGDTTVVPF